MKNEKVQSYEYPAVGVSDAGSSSVISGNVGDLLDCSGISPRNIDEAVHWSVRNPCPSKYLTDNYLVLDFETTNLDKGSPLNKSNRILLATWADGGGREYYKWGSQYAQRELLAAIAKVDFIVAHNAKFELQWLEECGLDLGYILVYDTMLADYVIAGNRSWRLDLDSVAGRYGAAPKNNLIKIMMQSGICPSQMPRDLLLKYGLGDTRTTRDVFLQQRRVLKEKGLLPVLYTRCLATPVLASIEKNGMQLDHERVKQEYDRVVAALGEHDRALHEFTGGINPNSPKQLAEYIYDRLGFAELTDHNGNIVRTDADGRKTDADTLQRLIASDDKQRRFKDLIKVRQEENTKLKSISKMMDCCKEDGGILYARFNQSVTQTHRLSSAGAKYKLQFQNFYRPYKSLFRARDKDWSVGEADGAQLEFRVAGHLGRDPVAKQDIESSHDVHKATASKLFGIPLSRVSKAQRQDAKPETFRPLYGSRGSTPEQKRYAEYFHDRYRATYNAQTDWTYTVLANKELQTEWGLIFYWPDTSTSKSGYIKNTTNIFNYPVQSLATAEIIPVSLVYFWHKARARRLKLFCVSTIHDSIIAEVPPDEYDAFNNLALECFTHDVYRYLQEVYSVKFTVPLGVETKIGAFWSEDERGGININIPPPV